MNFENGEMEFTYMTAAWLGHHFDDDDDDDLRFQVEWIICCPNLLNHLLSFSFEMINDKILHFLYCIMHDFFGMRIVPIYTVRFLMDSFITDLNIVLQRKKYYHLLSSLEI